MATYAKAILSGSTNGRNVLITATATPGTTIHTAVSGTSNMDEIFLAAVNSSSSSIKLTIEYGGVSGPTDHIEQTIPGESGLYWLVQGLLLQNSLLVKAFAGTGSVIAMNGYVNRITP